MVNHKPTSLLDRVSKKLTETEVQDKLKALEEENALLKGCILKLENKVYGEEKKDANL